MFILQVLSIWIIVPVMSFQAEVFKIAFRDWPKAQRYFLTITMSTWILAIHLKMQEITYQYVILDRALWGITPFCSFSDTIFWLLFLSPTEHLLL